MCGIAGLIDSRFVRSKPEMEQAVLCMRDSLVHRGPNDSGVWLDCESGVALGHTRLSIVDLSREGHQPMVSRCGRYVVAFNGEIYNYREVRASLDTLQGDVVWRGHSDTEVLLAAIAHWGVRSALQRCNGMFAFALWDRRANALYLARDRLGEKPLYYGQVGKVFLFGSELKALRAHPVWQGTVDRNALGLYLRHNYIPAPYSIYQGVFKLNPGMLLTLPLAPEHGTDVAAELIIEPYWSPARVAEQARSQPFRGSEDDAISELGNLLRESVRLRMEADVPLGAFLSGGVDSSTIVALMQSQSDRPVKTFTIGFQEAGYDEAVHAARVARYLGTEHTELYVTPTEAMAAIPRLATVYDEPFSDSSQIPSCLVSELTRRHVTVSLAGDGGDELFAGYSRYFWLRDLWKRVGWMPARLRGFMGRMLISVSPVAWDRYLNSLGRLWAGHRFEEVTGDRLHKIAYLLDAESPHTMYERLVSHWRRPERLIKGAAQLTSAFSTAQPRFAKPEIIEWMTFIDSITYLPDDLLVKADRASMSVGLEVRMPMLDHRLVEFAWSIPVSMKVRDGKGKWLLRRVLDQYVPKELVERRKMGFAVPLGSWLRGPLREWAENLLDTARLTEGGYFDPAHVRKKWVQHLSGERNWEHCLWDVLMFQAWLAEQ